VSRVDRIGDVVGSQVFATDDGTELRHNGLARFVAGFVPAHAVGNGVQRVPDNE
jgi:hypothetical protein